MKKIPDFSGALRRLAKNLYRTEKPWPIQVALQKTLEARLKRSITINYFDRAHAEISAALNEELHKVLAFRDNVESDYYQRKFEHEFAGLCARKYAIGTNSGTAALELSLKAFGIGPGDEVITVPNSYVATALAISNIGATPVFIDVDPSNCNLDPEKIASAVGPRTKAVLPVYLYGQMADMPGIERIAKRLGLKVIVDACQGFDAELHGKGSGFYGDAVCYSFSTPKTLSGFGNGGMMVTDDREAAKKIRAMKDPESLSEHVIESHRTPCFLDPIQIAFIRAKLPKVGEWVRTRRDIANRYRQAFAGLDLVLPKESAGSLHTYYNFPILSKERNRLRNHLHAQGIRTGIHYTPLIHLTPGFAHLGYSRGDFPIAESIESQTLSLPISQFLLEPEIEVIIKGVKSFFT